MSKLNLAISEDALGWAKSRVDAGEFSSIDAYFAELARRDQTEAEEAEWLQAAIDKGVASGRDPRASTDIFREIRAKYLGLNG